MCTSNNFYHSVIILSTPYTYEINNNNNNNKLCIGSKASLYSCLSLSIKIELSLCLTRSFHF